MAEVDAERGSRQPRKPCAGPCCGFLHEDKDRGGHQKDVDAGEIPDDFQIGVVARERSLHHHVARSRDEVADEERRDADAQRLAPAPCGREFHEVESQHEVAREARDVIEGSEFVPVADAVEAHVAVIAGVAQRRGEHLHVGQQQRRTPDAEHDPQVAPRGPFEPCAQDRQDEIEPEEHVEIPERGGVVGEVEDEGPHLAERGFAGEQRGVDRRAGRADAAHVEEIEHG